MARLRILFLLISCFVFIETSACLNGESKALANGWLLYMDDESESDIPSGHNFYNLDKLEDVASELDSLYNATKNIDYYSDKGLILIILKRYVEAIKIYEEIEKIAPNRYSTASNIGTAYELTGKNDLALKWIKRSVEIDPSSHNNSEWIHVRILQVKLLGDSSINSTNLIGIDFGNEYRLNDVGLDQKQLNKLATELKYQLQERMSFVVPKDKIVSLLLLNLGTIYYQQKRYFDAIEVLDKALEYSNNIKDTELINDRKRSAFYNLRNDYEKLLLKSKPQKSEKNMMNNRDRNLLLISTSLISVLLISVIGIYFMKRRKMSK